MLSLSCEKLSFVRNQEKKCTDLGQVKAQSYKPRDEIQKIS